MGAMSEVVGNPGVLIGKSEVEPSYSIMASAASEGAAAPCITGCAVTPIPQ